jgi:hypothetical protein
MIDVTNKGQRKMYERWVHINDKYKKIKECKLVLETMDSINKVIKSVNDSWLS